MTCDARLGDSAGLLCLRTDDHATGHIFVSGSYVDDRHGEGGHG